MEKNFTWLENSMNGNFFFNTLTHIWLPERPDGGLLVPITQLFLFVLYIANFPEFSENGRIKELFASCSDIFEPSCAI